MLSQYHLVSFIVQSWFLAVRDVLPVQHITLGHQKKVTGPFRFTKPNLERGPVTAVVTAEHLVTRVVRMLLDGKLLKIFVRW